MSKLAGFEASRRQFLQLGGGAALAVSGLSTSALAQGSRPLVYAYANWSDALAITFIAKKLIEDTYGYKVQPLQAEPGVIYASLQSGKADAYSNAYMQGKGPLKGDYRGGQADYVKKVADSIDIIGVSEGPMTQGLAVPDYVDIDSIEQLNEHAEKFGNKIIGIDAGSGLMKSADNTVKAYGIKLDLVAGSEAAMEAAFGRAYARKDWVAVTTWEPLPMWTQYKMKYLKDSKSTMMEEPFYCFHTVRKDFKDNFPKAYEFFKKFHIPNDQEALVMSWIDKGAKPEEAAAKWIDANKGKGIIEEWVA